MRKKLIIISGVMGVGKTTISKMLYKELENSFWLDGDNCWMMNPFIVNDENKNMVLDNIAYMLNNFIKNSSSKYIIFNWVIHTDEIMKDILYKLNLCDVDLYKISLICSKEELISRIKQDIKTGSRDDGDIERSLERLSLYNKLDTIKIDTTCKEPYNIVNEIKEIIFY